MRCKWLGILLIATFFALPSPGVCGLRERRIDTQVVAVYVTKKVLSYHKPWKSPNFVATRGTGFFFRDRTVFPDDESLILTNAHVVSDAQKIEISNGREKRRYQAHPVGICHVADFAVLRLDPEETKAYEKRNGRIVPLPLGDSDRLRVGDKVLGWGYPLGGERISKSEQGEINRIEVGRYAYSHESWLMVQASLQQNPGNSGGPIFKGDKVVGIAFQGIRATDRINYFIPIGLVKHLMPLLNHPNLVPRWRWVLQHMFPQLKAYYHLGANDGGVLVNYLIPGGGPYTFGLRNNDILMEIDGNPIDDFGDVFFKPLGQRISFTEVLNRKKVGDPLSLKVMREGSLVELKGEVTSGLPWLVPRIFGQANYFICGGIGFLELTQNSLRDLGKNGYSLRQQYLDKLPEQPYQKVVIVIEIFPEYGMLDTGSYLRKRVEKISGRDVLNIEQLYDTIESLKADGEKTALVSISNNVQLPINLETAPEKDAAIQKKYGILYMKTPGGFSK
ncbi:MAG: trypsin-like peptidase domain-containing protein [Deltaproteobacteria bacterium]|nr:trypsin-like peptidase domain-containing protein [Deltaproteobacteria bacterium]